MILFHQKVTKTFNFVGKHYKIINDEKSIVYIKQY